MVMKLGEVVPYGRCLDEYRRMFLLTPEDLQRKVLGVGDGPASFNAEASAIGANVCSVDPLYSCDLAEIQARVDDASRVILRQVVATHDDWEWTYHASPEALQRSRTVTHNRFFRDYPKGKFQGRYRSAALPRLPFEDGSYDLGLCSHLLFLYSEQLGRDFHIQAIRTLLRVCREVRIFPLLDLELRPSPHIEAVVAEATRLGFQHERSHVTYSLQKGGDEMLRIYRNL